MSYDKRLQATASKLLAKFGQPITVQVFQGNTSDPITGGKTETYTNATGNGVTLGYKGSEVDQSMILDGDIKLIIENLAIEPTVNSKVPIDGKTYRVKNKMKVKPKDLNIYYELRLRR